MHWPAGIPFKILRIDISTFCVVEFTSKTTVHIVDVQHRVKQARVCLHTVLLECMCMCVCVCMWKWIHLRTHPPTHTHTHTHTNTCTHTNTHTHKHTHTHAHMHTHTHTNTHTHTHTHVHTRTHTYTKTHTLFLPESWVGSFSTPSLYRYITKSLVSWKSCWCNIYFQITFRFHQSLWTSLCGGSKRTICMFDDTTCT